MSDYWEEMEKAEQERDAQEYALVKAYEDGESNGWNAAIDAFVNNVSESIIWDILAEVMKRNIGASDGADKIIDYLQKIAEQLKGERNDERKSD